MIASNILAEVNKEVKLAGAGQKKKRVLYLSFTPKNKAKVVQYSSVNRVRAAVQRFSKDLIGNLSMVRWAVNTLGSSSTSTRSDSTWPI